MFPSKVSGIPCFVRILSYQYYSPDPLGSSADDFYGGYEIDYEILDRNGRYASWLEKKLTEMEDERILEEIVRYMGQVKIERRH